MKGQRASARVEKREQGSGAPGLVGVPRHGGGPTVGGRRDSERRPRDGNPGLQEFDWACKELTIVVDDTDCERQDPSVVGGGRSVDDPFPRSGSLGN